MTGSPKRFTEVAGYSELFFALDGYAVLDNASMPIVGERRTVNDHFRRADGDGRQSRHR